MHTDAILIYFQLATGQWVMARSINTVQNESQYMITLSTCRAVPLLINSRRLSTRNSTGLDSLSSSVSPRLSSIGRKVFVKKKTGYKVS